jgi:hypothetical protein
MYIPTTFSAGSHLTPSLGNASLFEGVRNLNSLDKFKSILRGCSHGMMESERQTTEANVHRWNPLNTRIISFQGFSGGHILHRTR